MITCNPIWRGKFHIFQIYKDLEEKKVKIGDWYGKEKAWEVIRSSQERYINRKEI